MKYCSGCQNNNYVSQINQNYQSQTYSSKATNYKPQGNIASYGPYSCKLG